MSPPAVHDTSLVTEVVNNGHYHHLPNKTSECEAEYKAAPSSVKLINDCSTTELGWYVTTKDVRGTVIISSLVVGESTSNGLTTIVDEKTKHERYYASSNLPSQSKRNSSVNSSKAFDALCEQIRQTGEEQTEAPILSIPFHLTRSPAAATEVKFIKFKPVEEVDDFRAINDDVKATDANNDIENDWVANKFTRVNADKENAGQILRHNDAVIPSHKIENRHSRLRQSRRDSHCRRHHSHRGHLKINSNIDNKVSDEDSRAVPSRAICKRCRGYLSTPQTMDLTTTTKPFYTSLSHEAQTAINEVVHEEVTRSVNNNNDKESSALNEEKAACTKIEISMDRNDCDDVIIPSSVLDINRTTEPESNNGKEISRNLESAEIIERRASAYHKRQTTQCRPQCQCQEYEKVALDVLGDIVSRDVLKSGSHRPAHLLLPDEDCLITHPGGKSTLPASGGNGYPLKTQGGIRTNKFRVNGDESKRVNNGLFVGGTELARSDIGEEEEERGETFKEMTSQAFAKCSHWLKKYTH